MERVLVVGTTGSGKTTVAAALAHGLGAPHVELDALFWEAGWVSADDDRFRERVATATAGDRWVVCGNYRPQTIDITWPRADTVVWLDLPRRTVYRRILTRTGTRVLRRTELWNGNRESVRGSLAPDGIIRWAFISFTRNRDRYAEMAADPQWSHLHWVRLRSATAVRRFLRSLS